MDGKKLPPIGTPLCGVIFGVVGALIALMLVLAIDAEKCSRDK